MSHFKPIGRLRPMDQADLDQVAELFSRNFRNAASFDAEDFKAYISAVFFDPSLYSKEHGSIVYENEAGRILASVFALPMQISAHRRVYTGRLMSFLMKDREASSHAVRLISMQLRARNQDFCFSDTANSLTRKLVLAGGGEVLPVQSLKWRRIYRPGAHLGLKVSRKLPAKAGRIARTLAGIGDPIIRKVESALVPENSGQARSWEIDLDRFHQLAMAYLPAYSVRPAWSRSEFDWIINQARKNTSLGQCFIREVVDGEGKNAGAYIYFLNQGGYAEVFNIIYAPGRESVAVDELLVHCDREGYVAVGGMNQPFMMPPLSEHKYVSFRHRGHFWILTRHRDIIDAIRRNDIYLGGLASEAWSRLMTDFGRQIN